MWSNHSVATPGGFPGLQPPHSLAITFRSHFCGSFECQHPICMLSPAPVTLQTSRPAGVGVGLAECQCQAVQLQILRPPDLGKSLSLAGLQGCTPDMGRSQATGKRGNRMGYRVGHGFVLELALAPETTGQETERGMDRQPCREEQLHR